MKHLYTFLAICGTLIVIFTITVAMMFLSRVNYTSSMSTDDYENIVNVEVIDNRDYPDDGYEVYLNDYMIGYWYAEDKMFVSANTGKTLGDVKTLQDRYFNMPLKTCYNNQDIEIILFGEIQE